jgi:hypothetical protein
MHEAPGQTKSMKSVKSIKKLTAFSLFTGGEVFISALKMRDSELPSQAMFRFLLLKLTV